MPFSILSLPCTRSFERPFAEYEDDGLAALPELGIPIDDGKLL